jgi:asparagine synthetase B (glutamine-hydrolysing)
MPEATAMMTPTLGERGASGSDTLAPSLIDELVGAAFLESPDSSRAAVRAMSNECGRFGAVQTGSVAGPDWELRRYCCDAGWMSAQPAVSDDGRYALVWLGEVHNGPSLSAGCEGVGTALLAGFAQDGEASLERLQGIFTGVIIDNRARRVVLFSDRYATRGLFYLLIDGGVAFCTRVLPLCRVPGFRPSVNRSALARRLRCDFLIGDDTMIDGIEQVPPATILTFGGRELNRRTYWAPRYEPRFRAVDLDAASDAFIESVRAAVRRQAEIAPRPRGLTLSGGLDSRLLAAELSKIAPELSCVSYGMKRSWDVSYAAEIAATLGVRHESHLVDCHELFRQMDRGAFLTDGALDVRGYHGLALAGRLRPRMQSVCDGQAGDHFGGYLLNSLYSTLNSTDEEDFHRAAFEINFDGPDRAEPDLQTDFVDAELAACYRDVPALHRRAMEACRQPRFGDWLDAFNLRHRQRRYIGNIVNCIRCQVPTFTPFLDYAFVNFALTIPEELRRGRKLYLHVFRRHLPEMARIRWAATGRPVSKGLSGHGGVSGLAERVVGTIRRRSRFRLFGPPRSSYIDHDRWMLREPDWRSDLERSLTGDSSRLRPFLTRDFLRRRLDEFFGSVRRARAMSGLLATERFLRLVYPS